MARHSSERPLMRAHPGEAVGSTVRCPPIPITGASSSLPDATAKSPNRSDRRRSASAAGPLFMPQTRHSPGAIRTAHNIVAVQRRPARRSRSLLKRDWTQSIIARTHAARRKSRWTMSQYSADVSGTGGLPRSSSGSSSAIKHGRIPRPAPARIAASCIGILEARSAIEAPVSWRRCSTQRGIGKYAISSV